MGFSVLLIIAAFTKGFDACNIRICLTWTVQNDHLDLRCRVNYLIYAVELINNQGIEQGFCISPKPIPACFSSDINTSMMQNTTTNVTFLRISGRMDSQVNGQWECKHGTNIDRAFIDVTVLDSDKRCWQSYLAYTMIGFVCPIFIIVSLLVYGCRKCKATACYRVCALSQFILNSERCNRATPYVRVFVPFVILVLFLIPVIKGLIAHNNCKDEEMYIIVGLIMAVLLSLPVAHVYMKREKAVNSSIPTNQNQDADHAADSTEETQTSDTTSQGTAFLSEDL